MLQGCPYFVCPAKFFCQDSFQSSAWLPHYPRTPHPCYLTKNWGRLDAWYLPPASRLLLPRMHRGLQPSEQCTHCWSCRLAPPASGGTRQRVRPSAVTTAAVWLTTQEGQGVHSQAANFIVTQVLQFKVGKHKEDTQVNPCSRRISSNQVGVPYLLVVTSCCGHVDKLRLLHSVS